MKKLRAQIKKWNTNVFRDCFEKVQSLGKALNDCDQGLSDEAQRRTLEISLQQTYENKESFLKQKSRLKWEVEGDCNSKFFHSAVKYRLKKF